MGVDIHGWVEIRPPKWEWWTAAIRIDDIVQRNYAMFASLFGIRNYRDFGDAPNLDPEHASAREHGRFRAIAPGRGEPPRASEHYSRERNVGDVVGETWVLWSELAVIDWAEEGENLIEHERRGDHLNGGWDALFKLMEILAGQFGAENVRLAVSFDQW
jgi:hypothetical protein